MTNKLYPTDMTDSQWNHIKELIPEEKSVGRPRELDMRQVVNAIFYVGVGGIQWRLLPREYPKWSSVYYYFRRWTKEGVWERIHHTLRAKVRKRAGRHKHPTAGSLDSQSVKGCSVPGVRGYDANKKIKGRKRHVLVDTMGLLLKARVTPGDVQDRDGARLLLEGLPGSFDCPYAGTQGLSDIRIFPATLFLGFIGHQQDPCPSQSSRIAFPFVDQGG